MGKRVSLANVTFLIPVRIDSIFRLENLLVSVEHIRNCSDAQIIVLEASKYNNHVLENMLSGHVEYIFVEDHDPIFHRTRYINLLAERCLTSVMVIWDADILIAPAQLFRAADMLERGKYDVVFPYDGRFFDTTLIIREIYMQKRVLSTLEQEADKMLLPYGSSMGGGAIFIDRIKFMMAKGEDERFYGWGPEDWNRLEKWKIMGYRIGRVKGPLFHLSHPRDINGGHSNGLQKTVSFHILRTTQLSSIDELVANGSNEKQI